MQAGAKTSMVFPEPARAEMSVNFLSSTQQKAQPAGRGGGGRKIATFRKAHVVE